MSNASLRVAYVTNIPAPYRERMHELLAQHYNEGYLVIYCSAKEPNRKWEFKSGGYDQVVLNKKSDRMVHNNISIFRHLKKMKPDVVISSGFNPTMLYAFLWCILKRKKFIPYIDGTYDSEKGLSIVHKLVRKIVFSFCPVFIGTSKGTRQMYKSYKVPDEKIFTSCLCTDNATFTPPPGNSKKYDLMFSGQLIERKMPLFFAEVANKLQQLTGKINILILGDGILKEALFKKLDEYSITYYYPGFVQPEDLPIFYQQSKVFLFPTQNDPWGLVANEACAAGVPVLICKEAGAADDLIIHNYNGYILMPDVNLWAEHAIKLLTDYQLYQRFSDNAQSSVKPYNHHNSANSIIEAINFVFISNEKSKVLQSKK